MSGLAWERARDRTNDALRAGTVGTRPGAHGKDVNIAEADLVIAMHMGLPRELVDEWIVSMAERAFLSVTSGEQALQMIAGLLAQGLLVGFFTAEELAKESGA